MGYREVSTYLESKECAILHGRLKLSGFSQQADDGHVQIEDGLLALRLKAEIVSDSADQVFCITQVQVEVDLLVAQPTLGNEECLFSSRNG